MSEWSRREILSTGGAVLGGALAGCLDTEETSTDHSSTSPTRQSTPTPQSPEAFLPAETDGWTLERTSDYDWWTIGGAEGIRGHYTSPDGVPFQVVIMRTTGYAPWSKVRHWVCEVGWTVGLPYEEFAIAVSTGTVQQTFTPEKPPTMTQTPVPDTAAAAKTLLANSPKLTQDQIEVQSVTAEDC